MMVTHPHIPCSCYSEMPAWLVKCDDGDTQEDIAIIELVIQLIITHTGCHDHQNTYEHTGVYTR